MTHPKLCSKLGARLGLEPTPATPQLVVRVTAAHPWRFLLFGQDLRAATVLQNSRGQYSRNLGFAWRGGQFFNNSDGTLRGGSAFLFAKYFHVIYVTFSRRLPFATLCFLRLPPRGAVCVAMRARPPELKCLRPKPGVGWYGLW